MASKPLPFPELPRRMREEAFWGLVGRRESSLVEFKETTEKAGRLQPSLVAFANGQGGAVVFGVAHPPPYRLAGCQWTERLEERIYEAARETRPPLSVDLSPALVDGRTVVFCQVAALERGWAQTSSGATVVRAGPTNRTLFGAELERFIKERSSAPVEEEPALGFSVKDFRSDLVRKYVGSRLKRRPKSPLDALRSLGYTEPDGTPRLAGVLTFGKDPQRTYRRFGVEMQRLEGSVRGTATLRETLAVVGPLPEVIMEADRNIYDSMRRDAVVRGLIRDEVPEYPPVVVREALVNAVAHRDYSAIGTSVTVRLFDDAIEIESPGGLPAYVTLENLREVQYSRNPRIMDALNHLDFVEEAGQGINRMIQEMEAALLDPPEFEDRGSTFLVRLHGTGVFSAEDRLWVARFSSMDLSGHEKAALVYAWRQGAIRNRELRGLRHLDGDTARAVLQGLCKTGLMRAIGRGRGSRYVLGDAASSATGRMTLNDQLEAIFTHAQRRGSVANADVRGLLNIDRTAALQLLTELVRRGYLVASGQRRGRRYYPTEQERGPQK